MQFRQGYPLQTMGAATTSSFEIPSQFCLFNDLNYMVEALCCFPRGVYTQESLVFLSLGEDQKHHIQQRYSQIIAMSRLLSHQKYVAL